MQFTNMYAEVLPDCKLKIWEDYNEGDTILAILSHQTADAYELPFFKGEVLTFIEQYGDKYCKAKNALGDRGFIPLTHVVYKEVFHDKNWFQTVCTRKMANSCLEKESNGTFLLRLGSEAGQLVISSKSEDGVKHEKIHQEGSIYSFRGSRYSVDAITTLLQQDGYIPFNFTLPEPKQISHHAENARAQILTGGLAIAKNNFRHREKDPKFLTLQQHKRYIIIGISSDLNWYVTRDEVKGNEGFAPVSFFSNLTPKWFHGEQTISYADTILGQQTGNCTFLVTRDNFLYTLSARSKNEYEHLAIEYKNETVTCFNKTCGSIVELVNCLICMPAVPMVRHPIPKTNSDTLSLDSVELYLNALDEGIEHDYNIRIMLVGHYGAGKTNLANRLLNEPIDDTIQSTDGIEIHVKEACLNVENGQWGKYTTHVDGDRLEERIQTVILRCKSVKSPDHQQTDVVTMIEDGDDSSTESMTIPKTPIDTSQTATQNTTATDIEKRRCLRRSAYGLTRQQRKSISELVKRRSGDVLVPDLSPISIWDFAGQFIFYATHQVFMSKKALYILVLDLSKSLDSIVDENDQPTMCSNKNKRTVKSFIELWMKSIHMTNDGDNSDLPAVLMIGTHEDKLSIAGKDKERYIADYFENVRTIFDDSPLLRHIQPEQFYLDARIESEVVKDIQKAVYDICSRLPWWGEEKPARWINLEQILINLQHSKKIVKVEELLEENHKSQLPVETEEEVRLFLRKQHNAGNIIYFEENGLANTVVLQPQWIVDAFKSLVTSQQFWKRYPNFRKSLDDLHLKGVLNKAFIEDLWKTNAASKSFLEHMNELLLFMENLNILAKMKTYAEGELFYFVPSLLPQAELDIASIIPEENRSAVLTFIVGHDYSHPHLFNVILAALIGRWNVLKVKNEVKLTGAGGAFALDQSKSNLLVVTISSNTVNCYVANMSGSQIYIRMCDEVRRFITATIAKQIRVNVKEVFELAIKCDQSDIVPGSDNLHKCDLLAQESEVMCFAHKAPHSINARTVLLDWFPDGYTTKDKACLNEWVENSTEYVNDRRLTDNDLEQLSRALGIGWEHIGHSLGVSGVMIEHCKLDYPHKTEMQIYQMLKIWKYQESEKGPVTFVKYTRSLFDNFDVHIDWDRVKNVCEGI